jgi:hypothetical protein
VQYKEASLATGQPLYSDFQRDILDALKNTPKDDVARNIEHARRVEDRLHNQRLAKHNVSKQIKKLARVLNKLTHPDFNQNDLVLADLFTQGQEALQAQDIEHLQSLIDEAKAYKSGNRNVNRLKAASAKLKRAREKLAKAKQERIEFTRSFNNRALKLTRLGQHQQLDLEFEACLRQQVLRLESQLKFLEQLAKGYGLRV